MIGKLGVVVHNYNSSSWKAEVKEYHEFKDIWATYIVK